jgi:yecA family protein
LLAKRIKWRRFKEPPPSLVPPDIQKFGSVDFLASDRSSLSAWLSEEDWPRDTMSVVAIEGYLVAMIVWPVNVPPGAWLPAIWGIRGWKVAAKIEAPACYDRFLRLILGYRQHLTHILNTAPLSFVPALHESVAGSAAANAAMRWSQGFMAALQQGSQGLDYRSSQSISAVRLIAFHASSVAPFSGKSESALAAELGNAVRTIISEIQLGIRKPAARLAASAPRH